MEFLAKMQELGFMQSGLGWAVLGAMFALGLGGAGSAWGIGIAGQQGAGVLSEKPGLFGKVFLLVLLPGTQGLYGMVFAFLLAGRIGLSKTFATEGGESLGVGYSVASTLPTTAGMALCGVGLLVGLVLLISARYQGEVAAASINLVAKKEDQFGGAIILPALVETYAVFALLIGILMMGWIINAGISLNPEAAQPAIDAAKAAAEAAKAAVEAAQ